jgi:heme A synthase
MADIISRRESVTHWIASVGLHLLLPLAPLFIERLITSSFGVISMTLSAAMYAISTGVGSKNVAILIISLLIFFFYSAMYGAHMYASTLEEPKVLGEFSAGIVIICMLVTNMIIKFIYHIIDLKPLTDIVIGKE